MSEYITIYECTAESPRLPPCSVQFIKECTLTICPLCVEKKVAKDHISKMQSEVYKALGVQAKYLKKNKNRWERGKVVKKYVDIDLFAKNIASIGDLRTLSTKTIGEAINKTPAADVRENIHAKWIDKYGNKYDNHFYICSNCGGKALYDFEKDELGNDRVIQVLSQGCPHCFAIMDGGKKE